MSMAIQLVPTMPSRPCTFCLCLQGGSVFADFDTDDSRTVWLRRISFDGYGCYEAGESIQRMTAADSHVLLDAVARNDVSTATVEAVLRQYFRQNRHIIWRNALEEHNLV